MENKRHRNLIRFEVEGIESTVILIAKAKGITTQKPYQKITIKGMNQDSVVAFIRSAISYSLARYGTLDASKWEDTLKGDNNG